MGIVCLALLTSLFEPIPCWGHLEILPPVGITEELGFTVSNMRKYMILRKDANCSEWFSPEPWKEVIEYKRADRKKKIGQIITEMNLNSQRTYAIWRTKKEGQDLTVKKILGD